MNRQRLLALGIGSAAVALLAWKLPDQPPPDLRPVPTPAPTSQPLIRNGSRAVPEIALTFDACPAIGFDTGIVHVLTETQTPATIFLSGRWMQSHISATQQLASISYFELGDHSWDHANFSRLGAAQIALEITRTEQLLTQLTGRTGTLFRFPYGYSSSAAIQEIYRLGLTPIQWDVVSGDPSPGLSAKSLIARVTSKTRDGSIIIMHINGRGWHTAEALPTIIARLREQGYEFVTVSQLLADRAWHRRDLPLNEP
jgi:peptidoglycan/xylan/chitin deacetylase (PgdA/CDA1 family)